MALVEIPQPMLDRRKNLLVGMGPRRSGQRGHADPDRRCIWLGLCRCDRLGGSVVSRRALRAGSQVDSCKPSISRINDVVELSPGWVTMAAVIPRVELMCRMSTPDRWPC